MYRTPLAYPAVGFMSSMSICPEPFTVTVDGIELSLPGVNLWVRSPELRHPVGAYDRVDRLQLMLGVVCYRNKCKLQFLFESRYHLPHALLRAAYGGPVELTVRVLSTDLPAPLSTTYYVNY